MAKIRLLKEEVFRKIAAGEVIERPLSAVKELVENSLDAGARHIRILVAKGGKELIRIEDDGEGFPAAEMELAFKRHSTSKLVELDDLDRLYTLGFRGEALPSILEVAQIELQSADNDEGRGIAALFRDGRLDWQREIVHSRGSAIEVRDLFYNFPVRRKFLKSDAAELQQIVHFLETTALARPGVAFELVSNGRSLFAHQAAADLCERIYQLFGREFLDDLQVVDWARPPYRVHGFVSRPGRGLAQKNRQYFIVNHRPVREKTLIAALNNACAQFQEKGKNPVAVLHLEIPPDELDVNIHPMKLEIRFRDSSRIYTALRGALEASLAPGRERSGSVMTPEAPAAGDPFSWPRRAAAPPAVQHASLFTPAARADGEDDFTLLGQYQRSYIVIERAGELLLIDQHNARERILFDRLQRQKQSGAVASAATLFPVLIELSASEKNLLDPERVELLRKSGFEIADLGGSTIEIRTYPQLIEESRIKDVFRGLLELQNVDFSQSDSILAGVACKAAIKVNQALAPQEMRQIVRDLFAGENPHLCPHQRPIYAAFSLAEIEKLLRRR